MNNYIDYDIQEVHHKKKCEICGKPLRRFPVKRNGGNRKDWKKRNTHLKCWKKEEQDKWYLKNY